jgi:ribosomal-protein-alanine N-acetyltransferase
MIELQAPNWWEQLPVLSSPMLQLREVSASDAEALYELLNDPQVSQYISPPPPSPAAFEGFIRWAHKQRQAGACVCYAVVPHGLQQAVGLFQLRSLEPSFRVAEWGFALGSSFWSTGVFEEAATLVADFAFREIGVHRLEARAVVENGRGNRALEKLGAQGEAVLRKSFGRDYTQFLWAILAESWPPPKKTPNRFEEAKIKRQIASAIAATAVAPRTAKPAETSVTAFPFFLTGGEEPGKAE